MDDFEANDDMMDADAEDVQQQQQQQQEQEPLEAEQQDELVEDFGAADPYASVSAMDKEPASIRLWKEQQAQRLADMQKQAEAAERDLLAKAKKELAEWKVDYEKSINDRRARNKNDENEFIKLRDETTPGNEWERVGRLVDFTTNKVAHRTRDVSRMRTVLIGLKQTGLVRG